MWSFCDWFLSLSLMFSVLIWDQHISELHSFCCQIIFHYPFISWCIFVLFLLFGFYEYSCYKHSCASFCVDVIFSFLLGRIRGSYVTLFNFIAKLCLAVAAPSRIPISNVWGFPFLHILTNTGYCLYFDFIAILMSVKW